MTVGYIQVKCTNKYHKIFFQNNADPNILGKKLLAFLEQLKNTQKLIKTRNCVDEIINFFDKDNGYTSIPIGWIFIDWVYTIDLDQMVLKIKGQNVDKVYNLLLFMDNKQILEHLYDNQELCFSKKSSFSVSL